MKRQLAIFMHGGMPNKISSQGFPKIVQIVEQLSNEFTVSVYSLTFCDKNLQPSGINVFSPPYSLKLKLLRWIYLFTVFLSHHIHRPYHFFYSFWGYPIGFVVVLIAKALNRPVLVNILGAETAHVPEINYGHLRRPLTRKLVIWTCKQADELIAVSPYQVEILNRYGLYREVHVVPFGADKKLFFPIFNKPEPPLKIIHVANLTAVKDQATLIRTFQLIQKKIPARLRIVGGDFFNGKIQQLVKELDLQDVEFTGFISHQDLTKHYHWADAFMLTSLSEGQNNSITEAMMCGLLPISTAVGSMDNIFGNEVGIVADCKDFEALADKVVELFHRTDEWEKRRRAAFKWADEHDLNWTVAQLNAIISNAK